MGPIGRPDTSVQNYQSTRCQIPVEGRSQLCCSYENVCSFVGTLQNSQCLWDLINPRRTAVPDRFTAVPTSQYSTVQLMKCTHSLQYNVPFLIMVQKPLVCHDHTQSRHSPRTRTRNPRKRVATDRRFLPRGHRTSHDVSSLIIISTISYQIAIYISFCLVRPTAQEILQ
jgi:hypothetical protein